MNDSMSTTALRAARAGKQAIIDLVLPPVCRLCNAPVDAQEDFCMTCLRELSASRASMRDGCLRCGMPQPRTASPVVKDIPESTLPTVSHGAILAGEHEKGSDSFDKEMPGAIPLSSGAECAFCRGVDFEFDAVVALWAYQARVCEAVVAAKYPRQAALGDALGRRLGEVVLERMAGALPDVVTFVPSYLTRALARGGTGTSVIADAVARSIGRPCRSLVRAKRSIAKQAWLDDEARAENVHDAFSAKRSYPLTRSPQPPNRHILIVDDVLTTGATANAVAGVLHGIGAKRVSLAVVARAIRSRC